jgi:hypothetical protein
VANGGWNASINHVFGPRARMLYLGDDSQRSQWQLRGPMSLDTHAITAAGTILAAKGMSWVTFSR